MVKPRFLLPLALAGLFALPTAASANQKLTSISFQGNGTLLTNPGNVNVTVRYVCPPPNGAFAVVLRENGMEGVSEAPEATCDGNGHLATLTVIGMFTPGTAEGVAAVVNGTGTNAALANQKLAIK
jgi:hypothetical protein